MSKFIRTFILLLTCFQLQAQQFEWKAGYDGFLDNREYFNDYIIPQTIFGSRIHGEIGGSLDGVHSLMAGINYMYEFGGTANGVAPSLTMYYNYDLKPYTFYMGAFPRRGLLDFPLALLNDTLNYYRPNIEGAYLSRYGDWGYEEVFIDWTSRQTDQDPEHFLFGFSGRVNMGPLFVKHHLLMGHFAGPGIPIPGDHLRDNGGFDLSLGVDLSDRTVLDTLVLSAGALVSLDRIRGVDEGWQTPAGVIAQLDMKYRFAGIRTTLHAGDGHTFLYGDAFYRAPFYTRIDMFIEPVQTERVHTRVDFSLHLIEGTLDTSQQVFVFIDLDHRD